MKFVFDPVPGSLDDFLKLLSIGINFDPKLCYKTNEMQLDPDPVVKLAFEYIWRDIDKNIPGLETVLPDHRNGESFLSWHFGPQMWNLRTPEAFISAFGKMKSADLKTALIKYFDAEDKISSDECAAIIKDPEKTFDFIDSLDLCEKVKWELQSLIRKPESMVARIVAAFKTMAVRYDDLLKQNAVQFKNIEKSFAERVAADKEKLFLANDFPWLKEMLDSGKYTQATVTCVLIDEYGIRAYEDGKTLRIFAGMNCRKAQNSLTAGESWDQLRRFFKILEDDIRFKIFSLLLDKELYLGELSDMLGVAISTTAYHVDFFIQDKIINVRVSGKRVYYSINSARIDQLMKIFDLSFRNVLNRLNHEIMAG